MEYELILQIVLRAPNCTHPQEVEVVSVQTQLGFIANKPFSPRVETEIHIDIMYKQFA